MQDSSIPFERNEFNGEKKLSTNNLVRIGSTDKTAYYTISNK